MRSNVIAATLVLIVVVPALTFAEGLICQAPWDGAWARFENEGNGVGGDGSVQVTVKGTQTIRCVGTVELQGERCRWIELDTEATFTRKGSEPGKLHEIFKLLISEKDLAEGKNPRDGVRVAYHKRDDSPVKQLDLKGDDARQIESLDEIFHGPLEPLKTLPTESVNAAGKAWECRGVEGRQTTNDGSFSTVTRLHKEAPFGVVTYSYEKQRLRDGQPAGGRSMTWKLAETGTDAVSVLPDSQ